MCCLLYYQELLFPVARGGELHTYGCDRFTEKKCKNLVAFYPKLTGCSSWMMEGLKNLGNLRIIPGILLPTGSKQV